MQMLFIWGACWFNFHIIQDFFIAFQAYVKTMSFTIERAVIAPGFIDFQKILRVIKFVFEYFFSANVTNYIINDFFTFFRYGCFANFHENPPLRKRLSKNVLIKSSFLKYYYITLHSGCTQVNKSWIVSLFL